MYVIRRQNGLGQGPGSLAERKWSMKTGYPSIIDFESDQMPTAATKAQVVTEATPLTTKTVAKTKVVTKVTPVYTKATPLTTQTVQPAPPPEQFLAEGIVGLVPYDESRYGALTKKSYEYIKAAAAWAFQTWGSGSPYWQKLHDWIQNVWKPAQAAAQAAEDVTTPSFPAVPTYNTAAESLELPDIGMPAYPDSEQAVAGEEIPTFIEAAAAETSPWLKYALLGLGAYIFYDSFVKSQPPRRRRKSISRRRRRR